MSVKVSPSLTVRPNLTLTDTNALFAGSDRAITLLSDVTSNAITIGATGSETIIAGDLTVNGDTFTLNVTTFEVEGNNLTLNAVDTPSDANADGGGFTLKGTTDKTMAWSNSNKSWDFNQIIRVGFSGVVAQLGATGGGSAAAQIISAFGTAQVVSTDALALQFDGTLGSAGTNGIVISSSTGNVDISSGTLTCTGGNLNMATNSITNANDITGTTIGGIITANLVDKTATETVSGAWRFDLAPTIDSNAANTAAILTLENTAGDFQIFRTDATPEGAVTGSIGDIAIDGTNGVVYNKTSGSATNTGWQAFLVATNNLAEMTIHENGTPLTIDSTTKEHAVRLFGAGNLSGFTFDAGSTGPIANTSDNGGTLRITDVGHGLVTGDVVTITGLATASQNDVTAITRIDDDTFDCDDITFATGSETGTWNQGSHLIAGTDAAGTYLIHLTHSTTSALVNKTFEWHIYIDTTRQDNMGLRRRFSSTDVGVIAGSAIITVAVGNKIWLAVQNQTDANNLTHIHGNLNLHQL